MAKVFLSGIVGEQITLASFRTLVKGQSTTDDLFIHINSEGGDVIEGWAIYDEIRAIAKSRKVTTINDGMCASMGSVLLMAGDEVLVRPNSKVMIHNPWGGTMGDAKEIKRYASFIQEEEERLARFYSKKTGIDLKEVFSMMDKETWMDAETAINKGFANGYDRLRAVALITKKEEMKDLSDENKNWLKSQFEALGKLFKGQGFKAMVMLTVVTEDGEMPIYVDSEDGEIEGKMVYMNESMTDPAPEGVHMLQDGREITVNTEGIIESVREQAEGMTEDEMEAMKKENVELKSRLEEMEANAKSMEEDLASKSNALVEASKYMEGIKAMVEGSQDKPKVKGKDDTTTKVASDNSLSPIEAALKNRK